jgi:hypothetical protein
MCKFNRTNANLTGECKFKRKNANIKKCANVIGQMQILQENANLTRQCKYNMTKTNLKGKVQIAE